MRDAVADGSGLEWIEHFGVERTQRGGPPSESKDSRGSYEGAMSLLMTLLAAR